MAGDARTPYGPGMERFVSYAAPDGGPEDAMAGEPAVRDAAAILARAEADDAAAEEARDRYSTQRVPTLEPDARIAPLLASDELVLAVRHGAAFDRRQSDRSSDAPLGLSGDLYVTSLRIVLIGRVTLSLGIQDIEEIGVSGERLILILRDGSSVAVQTGQPRLLRVEIGAARAQVRSSAALGRGSS